MKTDEEKLEDLVSAKSFGDLSDSEKRFVLDRLGSEEQFNALQRIHAHLLDRPNVMPVEPAPSVLMALRRKLRETMKDSLSPFSILRVKIPAYAALLIALITSSL